MILLIDNYDSFSYNLYQLVGSIDPDIRVVRNDAHTVEELAAMQPRAVILSPGPGRPARAGVCEQAVRHFAGKVPLLGVCLGHQAICEAFGATVGYAGRLMHGKKSRIHADMADPIFVGLPKDFDGARYHSLSVAAQSLPPTLQVLAHSVDDNEVMAVRHQAYPVYGLQFHPESILTPEGKTLVRNFLSL